MEKVQLCDRLGNISNKKIGFSWGYFVFGPLYSLIRGYIISSLLLLLITYYLIPLPGMETITSFILQISFIDKGILDFICKLLLVFRTHHYYILGIFIVLIFRILNSFLFRSRMISRFMKKKEYRPLEEKDARLLIKYHAANEKVTLAEAFDLRTTSSYKTAEENWYEDNQNRINNVSPSETKRYATRTMAQTKVAIKKEQIENLYKLGLISKEEYLSRIDNVETTEIHSQDNK